MKKVILTSILLSTCYIAHAQDTLNKLNAMGADRRARESLKHAQNTGTKVPQCSYKNASARTQQAVSTHNTNVAINGGKRR